jgi:anaerobic nitric oxide reductase transcription regulator
MTFEYYTAVIEDLSRELPAELRYRRLLEAINHTLPCDAIALLRLNGNHLQPVAFLGLRTETHGRRFLIEHHPRLAAILASRQPVRFDSDSPLPDPYDGLLQNVDELHVHDCMGVSIYIDDQPWGVITLDATRSGQFDEIDPRQQQLAITLTRAVITAAERINQLQQQLHRGHEVTAELNREMAAGELIGSSTSMQRLLDDIDVVAATPLTVLIEGETGVGKELVARRLHLKSDRLEQPLIQLNCAALPENLAEAELFGHTKGAFTGANEARAGRFELADGGTLFLDEVGELPLALQAKLLRVLQEGEVQRMGSDHTSKVNVRIVAATNRNLEQEVANGRFRADLYHRLSVFPIKVPPLRERGDDVLQLAEFFLERDQHRLNIQKLLLSASAQAALQSYSWPGNVRELEHLLSRAALKATRSQSTAGLVHIETGDLGLELNSEAPSHYNPSPANRTVPTLSDGSLREQTEAFQRQLISQALAQHQHNIAAAARSLAVDRSNLLRIMKRLGLHDGSP